MNYNNYEEHYSKIVTLVENFDTSAWVDLNESEAELLDMLSENVDRLHEEYLDECMSLAESGATLNELSVYDVKDKAKKAWDAIVDFFKRAIQYIQKKIRGQMDNLSVEIEKENGEEFIAFYAKARRIKKMNFEQSDKFTVIDVEEAHNRLLDILKQVDSNLESRLKESYSLDEAGYYRDAKNKKDLEGSKNNPGTDDKEEGTGNIYRDFLHYVKLKDKTVENLKSDYIPKINKFYQKAIDMIHKVGKSAIKNAKKTPTRDKYKKYVAAKSLSAMCLNINTLIKIQND